MATLVNTSAVQALGWSSILRRCSLEKSYLPILAVSMSNPNRGLSEAAKAGDMALVLYFVSQGANDWNEGMRWSACGGHMDLVLYFVSQGANDWIGLCARRRKEAMKSLSNFSNQK